MFGLIGGGAAARTLLRSSADLHVKRGAQVYGWINWWMDGWTGYKKCPSIFCILSGYIESVYINLYILKNCHQHSYGFESLMSSWGVRIWISKSQFVGVFSFFRFTSIILHRENKNSFSNVFLKVRFPKGRKVTFEIFRLIGGGAAARTPSGSNVIVSTSTEREFTDGWIDGWMDGWMDRV